MQIGFIIPRSICIEGRARAIKSNGQKTNCFENSTDKSDSDDKKINLSNATNRYEGDRNEKGCARLYIRY